MALLLTVAGAVGPAVKTGVHGLLGGLVFTLAATLAFRLRSRLAVGTALFAAAGGLRLIETGSLAFAQIAHALLGQGLLAGAFLLALETSPGWHESSPLEDSGFPSLRQLAWLTPSVTILQISLGAAFRHKALGVIPHASWAFATAICVMMAGTFVLTQTGSGRLLRKVSLWLLLLTGLQILLGVAAYVARIEPSFALLGIPAAAHVATGGAVLALSCVWSAVVWRDTSPASETLRLNSGRPS